MTDSLSSLQQSDEIVSAVSERREPPVQDPAVVALAAIAAYADAAPRPSLEQARVRPVRRGLQGRRRLGLAVGVALAFSSSGIAAAVTGDPLAPVTFVVKHLYDLGRGHAVDEDDEDLGSRVVRPQEPEVFPTAFMLPADDTQHELHVPRGASLSAPVGDGVVAGEPALAGATSPEAHGPYSQPPQTPPTEVSP